MLLNISKDRNSRTSLGKLFQCSITYTVKKFFPVLRWNLLYSSLCPLSLILALGTNEEPGSVLFVPSLQVVIDVKIFLKLLLKILSLLLKMLQSLNQLYYPMLDSLL